MKIVHVLTGFDPKWGGVYQVVVGLAGVLKKSADIVICSTTGGGEGEILWPGSVPAVFLKTPRWKYQFSFQAKQGLRVSEG